MLQPDASPLSDAACIEALDISPTALETFPTAESPTSSSPSSAQRAIRRRALYCTPHIKVPGVLTLSSVLVIFEPDVAHPNVREFSLRLYELRLEVQDVIECGAIVMPLEMQGSEEDDVAFFLQMYVRTIDGRNFGTPEHPSQNWYVVFRLRNREELYDAARLILASTQRPREMEPDKPVLDSSTSVPFPCLDCASEAEAAAVRRQRRQQEAPAAQSPVRQQVVLRLGDHVGQTLLTQHLAQSILDYLPISLRLPSMQWVLRYSPKAHGVSLATMYRNLEECKKTVLVIQDAGERIFGGFAPECWEPCHGRFYGSGEAFVFSCGGLGRAEELQVYPWTTWNNYFLHSDYELIAMGGGNGRHAIAVRSDFLHGCSSPTQTFANPILASSEEFVVRDLEIWALAQAEA